MTGTVESRERGLRVTKNCGSTSKYLSDFMFSETSWYREWDQRDGPLCFESSVIMTRPPQSAGTGNQVPRHILLKQELSGTF